MEKNIKNQIPVEKLIKAFANKNRLKIIEVLEKKPDLSVENISDEMDLDFKVISFHLSKLAGAGVIAKKYLGSRVLHKLTLRGKNILKFVRMLE